MLVFPLWQSDFWFPFILEISCEIVVRHASLYCDTPAPSQMDNLFWEDPKKKRDTMPKRGGLSRNTGKVIVCVFCLSSILRPSSSIL